MDTCFSCIASRRADWVFGGDLLISSAMMKLANIGPLTTSNPLLGSNVVKPVMSVGKRSTVNCILFDEQPLIFAKVLITNVFAIPPFILEAFHLDPPRFSGAYEFF